MLQQYIQHVNDMLHWQDEWLRLREAAKQERQPETQRLADEALRNKKLAEQKVRAMKMEEWLARLPVRVFQHETLDFTRREAVQRKSALQHTAIHTDRYDILYQQLGSFDKVSKHLLTLKRILEPTTEQP